MGVLAQRAAPAFKMTTFEDTKKQNLALEPQTMGAMFFDHQPSQRDLMSQPNDNPPESQIDEEEVRSLIHDADTVYDDICSYLHEAKKINAEHERRNPDKDLSLDDVPFGEEVFNLTSSVTDLSEVINQLDALQPPYPQDEEVLAVARDVVDAARATLKSLAPLLSKT